MNTVRCVLAAAAGLMLTGCMPKMTIEEMKAEMPGRPAELDELDKMVGTWSGDGTAVFAMLEESEQELKSAGRVVYKWDKSKRYLIGEHDGEMGPFGTMNGIETITYDSKAKKFRSTWTDSMGSVGTGMMWYDAKNDIWKIKATAYSGFGKSTMKGTYRYLDDNTMEWDWNEYMMGGMMKTVSMKGTSRRQ